MVLGLSLSHYCGLITLGLTPKFNAEPGRKRSDENRRGGQPTTSVALATTSEVAKERGDEDCGNKREVGTLGSYYKYKV